MITLKRKPLQLELNFSLKHIEVSERTVYIGLLLVLSAIAIIAYLYFYQNNLALAYNDARSHLNIGRRVVEGLKTGAAQLGSVWLPLPHALMVPTVWNDFMWHSGLSGAIQSMAAFVATGLLVYLFLKELGVRVWLRVVGVVVFVANINVLYLQSTAMTELLLLATMTAAVYKLYLWQKYNRLYDLLQSAFFVMLATLIRYDGWFLSAVTTGLVALIGFLRGRYAKAEGLAVLYATLALFGVLLWLLWNGLIFGDPLFFAFGPYSAHAQQEQLEAAGNLPTKGNWHLSTLMYSLALFYNSNAFLVLLALAGAAVIFMDKKLGITAKLAIVGLFAPLAFNILALYLGHSVLFLQGISGDTWFNVRYGIMLAPTVAICIAYLLERANPIRYTLLFLIVFVTVFTFLSKDAVTIDDARVGSSQKNVSEVSQWLKKNAAHNEGFVLISAASHDAIIFSSGMPMKRFIHEGTGNYWKEATTRPQLWARYIIMRTNDVNDSTFRFLKDTNYNEYYHKVASFPFADVYELKEQYVPNLNTKPIPGFNK